MARQCASELTPRSILEKFKTIQMIEVTIPTVDGRIIKLPQGFLEKKVLDHVDRSGVQAGG
jgi:hypothetical protein